MAPSVMIALAFAGMSSAWSTEGPANQRPPAKSQTERPDLTRLHSGGSGLVLRPAEVQGADAKPGKPHTQASLLELHSLASLPL